MAQELEEMRVPQIMTEVLAIEEKTDPLHHLLCRSGPGQCGRSRDFGPTLERH